MVALWFLFLFLLLYFVFDIDFLIVKKFLFPGKTDHEIVTMTGRTQMWQGFLLLVQKSPIIGHGFAVLSTGRGGFFANHPHNSMFSILLGTGALGMSVFVIFACCFAKEFIQTSFRKVPGAIGCTAAIIAGLINSLAMPLVFDEWEESSLVFACMMSFLFYL